MIRKRPHREPSRGVEGPRRRVLLGVVSAIVVVFVAATLVVLVWPPLGPVRKADAILSLNGPNENLREAEALSLVKRGYGRVLLFSQGRSEYRCPVQKGLKVVCFEPNPGRTIGEAEWAGRYARQHHLHSLLVVAAQTQAVRALLLVGRCFGGTIDVVAVDTPKWSLPYDVLYGWGSLGRAVFVDRHC